MMAYGRLYACPELMLLYPHHSGLVCAEGILNRLRIKNSDDHLLIATVDVSTGQGLMERLRALVFAVSETSGSKLGSGCRTVVPGVIQPERLSYC